MHTIKFKGCLAQQDNKTFEVTVSKKGCSSVCYTYKEKLSGKELRTVVNKYLTEDAML